MKLSALLVLTLASPATADPEVLPEVRYAQRTVLEFSSVEISGEIERPGGAYVVVKRKPKFRTLIRVRGGFLPEIARSTDQL